MRALKYAFEEAIASLWRGRQAALLSMVTIAAALIVLGALLLVTWNADQMLAQWSTSAEMSVYLRDDVQPEDRAGLDRLLADSGAVIGREYVSKEEALARFRRDFADLAAVAGSFSENPFPASVEVRLKPEIGNAAGADALARRLAQTAGVADVQYDRRWIERVAAAIGLVRAIGVVIVTILIVAAALTVVNVVRLACQVRRDEIEIMQLVGAPLVYVRGPFVMEGVLQGGAGALVALGTVWLGFWYARMQYGSLAADVLGVENLTFLPWHLSTAIVAGGMLVGCVGGLIAATSTREAVARAQP